MGLMRCSIMDAHSSYSDRQFAVLEAHFEPSSKRSPEENLMLAVLVRAFRDATDGSRPDGAHPETAKAWFIEGHENKEEVYSFGWMCEELNLGYRLVSKLLEVVKAGPYDRIDSPNDSPIRFFQAKLDH